MKFCANLSFMFGEVGSLAKRYALAKDAGFAAVESGFPFGYEIADIAEAKREAGLQQILVNLYTGDTTKGELGCTFLPDKVDEFKKNLATTIRCAKILDCTKVHVMAGIAEQTVQDIHWRTYESNLVYATKELQKENLIGLIEPINNYTVPGYFMNSYEKGLNIIKKINSPNMLLMMDIFHLQQIEGSLTNNIKKLLPYVGHIQIAQVPQRNEPNTPGEIDYKYILNLLQELKYNGYVGLEYKPVQNTFEGLSWITEFGFN